MAFTLIRDDGSSTEYGDGASYGFNKAGFLVVETDDDRRLTFSPAAWRTIEEPKPGNRAYTM